ncbi:MAG: outer membrane protein assembly factor BamE [Gammaproteobacteria bacterium]|nr:outer membrane protein assembly factor BamE [Gammaproteobacteria bacterium]
MAPSAHQRRLRSLGLVLRLAILLTVPAGLLGGCVYRLDVQQGNLLDQTDIEAVQAGMTRSQVRYLLGTPLAVDPFKPDRWDYMYYLKPGTLSRATQRWVIVRFDGDIVREVNRDVPLGSQG